MPAIRVTRRQVMKGAVAVGGMGLAGGALGACGSGPGAWPDARLADGRAGTIDPEQFLGQDQLTAWFEELDAMGLRATGSPAHDRFVDTLAARLERAGVHDVHMEPLPIERWTATRWSLQVVGGPAAGPGAGPVPCAAYIPYSGATPPDGVAGDLVVVDAAARPPAGSLAGKVVLFEVPAPTLTYGDMELLAYDVDDPQHRVPRDGDYRRPWTGVSDVIGFLDALAGTGAVGVVGVLSLPAAGAHGSYFPYDGVIRAVPGVYVDAEGGRRLQRVAAAGGTVRLALEASVTRVTTANLVGTVPGAGPGTIVLNSHTDGPNAVEDNGPDAIVAIAQYLSRIPSDRLARGVTVSLTTGHFHGGAGQVAFVEAHRRTTLAGAACGLTLEHLGALAWDETAEGTMALTGQPELGVWFVPENGAMVAACRRSLVRAGAAPALVLRPFVATPGSPNGYGWPGEGTQLWTDGHLMTANYITGPTYLLNWGIPTVGKCDMARMRREAMAFAQTVLDLTTVPAAQLSTLDLPGLDAVVGG